MKLFEQAASIALFASAVLSTARAEEPFIVETGATPEQAETLGKVRAALELRGYKDAAPGSAAIDFEKVDSLIQAGRRAHTLEDNQPLAISTLEKAIEIIAPRILQPQSVAELPELRKRLLACLVISSQAQTRMDQPDKARELIVSLEHRFFDTSIPRAEFGPESILLRKKVVAELDKEPRGSLALEAPAGSDLYVEGALVGKGAATVELRAGSYNVYAVLDGFAGPPKLAKVLPSKAARLALRADSARERVIAVATESKRERAIVVGLSDDGIKLEGETLSADGKTLHSATVSVGAKGADVEVFLGELAGNDAIALGRGLEPIAPGEGSRFSTANKILQTTFIGIGTGLVVVGLVAAVNSEDDARFRPFTTALLGAGAGGVAVGGLLRWPLRF